MNNLSLKEAKVKLYRYCTYQERCHKEVNEKLFEIGIRGEDAQEIIAHLINEGFLNEQRFAKIFASSKFRLKNWGRLKIIRELEQREVSKPCINLALQEINNSDYKVVLLNLLLKKTAVTEAPNIYSLRDKVARFAIQKGFEPELVWILLKENVNDNLTS